MPAPYLKAGWEPWCAWIADPRAMTPCYLYASRYFAALRDFKGAAPRYRSRPLGGFTPCGRGRGVGDGRCLALDRGSWIRGFRWQEAMLWKHLAHPVLNR